MVKVIFEYDETTRKWDPVVIGTTSAVEARQAFSAVVITCQELDPNLLSFSKTAVLDATSFSIRPAV